MLFLVINTCTKVYGNSVTRGQRLWEVLYAKKVENWMSVDHDEFLQGTVNSNDN